jgi:hypothetical protein
MMQLPFCREKLLLLVRLEVVETSLYLNCPRLAARSPPLGRSGRRPPHPASPRASSPAPLPCRRRWGLPRPLGSPGWRRRGRPSAGGGAARGRPAGHGDGGGVRRRIRRPFGRIQPSRHRICGLQPSPYPPSLPSPRTPPVAPLALAVGGGCCCRSTAACSALGAACLRPCPSDLLRRQWDLTGTSVGLLLRSVCRWSWRGLLRPGRGLIRGLACQFCCGGGGVRPALCPSSVVCCARRLGPSVPGGPRPVCTTWSLEVAAGPWWPCRRRSTRGSTCGIKVMLMVAFL